MSVLGLKLKAIRYDNASEFATSTEFETWLQHQPGAVSTPTVSYNHTMNAVAENAIS